MIYTLTLSSQGQIVIPSKVRKTLGVKKGDKLKLRVDTQRVVPMATIEPETTMDWVERVSGIAKGAYGNVEEYIKNQRASWDLPR